MNPKIKKILIAGVGNDLRQDDAFGILFIRTLTEQADQWPNVKLLEVGIGGIHMVQELYDGYDVLIIADAVNYGDAPGTLKLRELSSIDDPNDMSVDDRRNFLADTHYATPTKAMMLAKALDILPQQVMILGCEAKNHDDYAMGVSEEVEKAIPKACKLISKWLSDQKLMPQTP